MRDLLGGKGANLAEMANLGLPVPPGFTITTDVCTYFYANGRSYPKDLLGGKGANLAEMSNLGLPVPPGFTITTEACRHYLTTGDVPPDLAGEVDTHLRTLEETMGKRLGDPADPLLVSVRSGAAFSNASAGTSHTVRPNIWMRRR